MQSNISRFLCSQSIQGDIRSYNQTIFFRMTKKKSPWSNIAMSDWDIIDSVYSKSFFSRQYVKSNLSVRCTREQRRRL